MLILGIETSCDETAAAVIRAESGGKKSFSEKIKKAEVLSDVVSSQVDIHRKYGGVVPEVAARAHIENIMPVVKEALALAEAKDKDVGCVAVTAGPGLITSLLVGVETAKYLAYLWKKPLVGVNHMEGHLFANFVHRPESLPFPAMCLTVSGGHTELILVRDFGRYKKVGQTRDDAAGESFDKAAKLLGIGYPGGPAISKLAEKGNPAAYDLPRPMIAADNFDFSFSGLKTAVLYLTRELSSGKAHDFRFADSGKKGGARPTLGKKQIADLCASFQMAAVDVLAKKTMAAAEKYGVRSVMLAGGVAANPLLRERLRQESLKKGLDFSVPPISLCTDNAVMIAMAGYFHFVRKDVSSWKSLKADSNMDIG